MAVTYLFETLLVIIAVVGVSSITIGVTVYTGDLFNAGTNAGVYMDLRGKERNTGDIKLGNSENNHERNDIDHYTLSVYEVGTPTSLRMRHDNSGAGAGWYLEKVEIMKDGKQYVFDCNQWLNDDVGLSVTLFPKTCNIPTAPLNGVWETERAPYVVHQTAVLQCDDGYVRSVLHDFQATITCRSWGSWSSTTAICCPVIENCQSDSQTCSNTENTCTSCIENDVLYRLIDNGQRCEALCSYNSHYCWPGYCTDDLTSGCACADGFELTSNATMTSCQLTKSPSIETCHTIVIGEAGQERTTSESATSTPCRDLEDIYGNFQPATISTELLVELSVNISSLTVPSFIHDSQLGVTDVMVKMTKQDIHLNSVNSTKSDLLQDTTNETKVQEMFFNTIDIAVPSVGFNLSNGERLCIVYETKGGGYLKTLSPTGIIADPVPYTKTSSSQELCYIYDDTAPEHCSQLGTCNTEPFHVAERITRSATIPVQFHDWVDPTPVGGDTSGASGIASYQVTVHGIDMSRVPLKVKPTAIVSQTLNSNTSSATLEIPTSGTQLYCIALKVSDKAGNVRHARRFVLIDKTSSIEIDQSKEVVIESASPATQNLWQTHHSPVCLIWKDYFHNRMYRDNNFLEQIEEDPSGLLNDTYDQTTGKLPISGTKHVNGIVKFEIIWGIYYVYKYMIANLTSQMVCLNISLEDGETYNLTVKASDIADNVRTESRTVHIDSSEPDITDFHQVSDSIEFSEIELQFKASDFHSGIKNIEWLLEVSDVISEMSGSVSVQRIGKNECPADDTSCYCPDVGDCEVNSYVQPLNSMVPGLTRVRLDNQTMFVTLVVTNHAMLSHKETIEFRVEHTPVEEEAESSIGLAIYVGVPVAVVVLCIIVVTLVLVCRRFRKCGPKQDSDSSSTYDTIQPSEQYSKPKEIDKDRDSNIYETKLDQGSDGYYSQITGHQHSDGYEIPDTGNQSSESCEIPVKRRKSGDQILSDGCVGSTTSTSV